MKKIGDYWVPDVDSTLGSNLEKTKNAFSNNRGIQIHHLETALKYCKEFDLAIDGGANVGSWTRELAKAFKIVHAFEPNYVAFECLQKNVSDWGIQDQVVLHNKAISDKFESVCIQTPQEGKRTVTARITGPGDTPAIPLDSLKIDHCSFIKLDLEGYEENGLKGAKSLIQNFKPWILIENKPQKWLCFRTKSEAEKLLQTWNYKDFAKIGDPPIDWLYGPAN